MVLTFIFNLFLTWSQWDRRTEEMRGPSYYYNVDRSKEPKEAHFLHHEQKQILLYQAPLFYSILFPFRTEKKSSLAAARSL